MELHRDQCSGCSYRDLGFEGRCWGLGSNADDLSSRQSMRVTGDVQAIRWREAAKLVVGHRGDVLELDLGARQIDRVGICGINLDTVTSPEDVERTR